MIESEESKEKEQIAVKTRLPIRKIEAFAGSLLEVELLGKDYDMEMGANWSKELADKIKHEVMSKFIPEGGFKLIVQVYIVEQLGQGLRLGTRAFSDQENDYLMKASFTTKTIAAYAVLHFIVMYSS